MTYKCTALAAVITYTLQHSKSQRPNSTKPNMGNEQDVTKLSEWHHQNIPVVNDKRSSYQKTRVAERIRKQGPCMCCLRDPLQIK